jgi:hypothetical protein
MNPQQIHQKQVEHPIDKIKSYISMNISNNKNNNEISNINNNEDNWKEMDCNSLIEPNRTFIHSFPEHFHVIRPIGNPPHQYRVIHIYDFDGTLFDTPLPHSGIQIYERRKGVSFPFENAWWSTKESLDMEVFDISPGPAYEDFYKSVEINNETSSPVLTMMITGRNVAIKDAVLDVLRVHEMEPHLAIFKPDYFPASTLAYKIEALYILVSKFPNLEEIIMWEDRLQHAEAFRNLGLYSCRDDQCSAVKLTVHYVSRSNSIEEVNHMKQVNHCNRERNTTNGHRFRDNRKSRGFRQFPNRNRYVHDKPFYPTYKSAKNNDY